jgi:hypothetical protein
MKITITFEKLEDLKFEHYEGVITLNKITEIKVDEYDMNDFVEMIGEDQLIEAIGEDKFKKYFGIDTNED